MKCPDCSSEMNQGGPHSEDYLSQWECHNCGKIIPIYKKGIKNRLRRGK